VVSTSKVRDESLDLRGVSRRLDIAGVRKSTKAGLTSHCPQRARTRIPIVDFAGYARSGRAPLCSVLAPGRARSCSRGRRRFLGPVLRSRGGGVLFWRRIELPMPAASSGVIAEGSGDAAGPCRPIALAPGGCSPQRLRRPGACSQPSSSISRSLRRRSSSPISEAVLPNFPVFASASSAATTCGVVDSWSFTVSTVFRMRATGSR
jgi:hypothetical protein